MAKMSRAVLLGAALLLMAAPRLLAQVTITDSGGGTGDNVLWQNGDQYGFSVTGLINGTTFGVTADNNGSGETLHAQGGQATVDRVDPADHSVSLPLHALGVQTESGVGFQEYIFDASRSSLSGTSTITFTVDYVDLVNGTFGQLVSSPWAIDTGSNWFTFTASQNILMTRVAFTTPLSSPTGDDGLNSAKQLRLTGAQAFSPPSVVPEGHSLALMMGGLLPLGCLLRRRRT